MDPLGTGAVEGRVEPRSGGEVLARFDAVPWGEFGVRVMGRGGASGGALQRQAPTVLRSSNITVTVRPYLNLTTEQNSS